MKDTKDMIVFKTVKLSEKLSKEELEKLRMQTAHKFFHASTYPSIFDPMGYSYGYADCTSEFTIKIEQVGFMSQDTESNILKSYYIDGLQVSKDTFDDVCNDIWDILQNVDNVCSAKQVKCNFPYSIITFVIVSDGTTVKVKKENEDMPKIVNYKYDEKTATTTLWWSDKTQTSVTADNVSEATQFEGFCAACAKKLFGNKSTYLNQFDKWTVKIPERERLAAEKKTAEDKAREEAKARKAAKKAERKRKRDIEIRAKQLADMYYAQNIEDEADKIAHEKYGVPMDWLSN